MHFDQNMSSVWVVFLVVTMVHQVYQSISSYLWSHDGKLPSRASNKQLPEAVQWESTSMLFEATSIQWCGNISLKESTGFLKQLSDSNGLVLVIKPWCTISKWFKMQRMLEPFMHLVASFGGGNGIDVYKKQTCKKTRLTNSYLTRLALPADSSNTQIQDLSCLSDQSCHPLAPSRSSYWIQVLQDDKARELEKQFAELFNCCWSSLLKSRFFLFSLAGARWFSWCHVCTWKRARKSQRILPGEPFSQAKQHSFLFFGTDFVITHLRC